MATAVRMKMPMVTPAVRTWKFPVCQPYNTMAREENMASRKKSPFQKSNSVSSCEILVRSAINYHNPRQEGN